MVKFLNSWDATDFPSGRYTAHRIDPANPFADLSCPAET